MSRNWSFGEKVGAGFAVIVLFAVAISAISIYALKNVVASKDRVISVMGQNLVDAARLTATLERTGSAARGYLLTREAPFLEQLRDAREQLHALIARVAVDRIERADADYREAIDRVIALRKTDAPLETVTRQFDEQVLPKRKAVDQEVAAFMTQQQQLSDEGKKASSETASFATSSVIALAGVLALLAIAIAFVLARSLTRQIGSAVQHVQSSSAELQSAANQQATGAKESSTAMNEITTTISELLATSRQIAESAQRVAQVAGETSSAARAGGDTIAKAHESVGGIKRQVDLIVTHMLDLGKKSQQIGGVLEIINELAEQTNILAINATIEAAGAGDAGKRFAVVADEIRKLADRVGGSTKEIRSRIEEIRSAVNTTVMATEGGTKAVDAGTRQFAEVTNALKQITGLVGTTTEAAREIELSTKQQSTAVEQVNVAIANVAQATRETEASSGQTLQTATQLTGLSRELTRLIQPAASA